MPAHTIIPFGVDAAFFTEDHDVQDLRTRHGITPSERVLLFVGKVMSPKGAFDCLEVLATLRAAGRPLRLVMIGDVHDRERQRFAARVAELRLSDALVLVGELTDRREIARYYQLADVVLFPSQYEQFGIVAIEAAASGRPLIGTPVGIMQTIVPQNGYGLLHPFGDLDRFASDLVEVLDHPRYRDHALRLRREVAAHYDWTSISARTERIYQQVAGHQAAGTSP
jgi:D-inositol-3-phosphate glycosyltransferase